MKQQIPNKVITAFINHNAPATGSTTDVMKAEAISGGLINLSYKVSIGSKSHFLLQRINKEVFVNPEEVQENYCRIWDYTSSKPDTLRLPSPRQHDNETTLFVDEEQNYWRAFEFIEGACMFPVASKPEQANAVANAFAKFTAAFEGFDMQQLKAVIPGFHDLSLRFNQFIKASSRKSSARIDKALPLINELKKREKYKYFYEVIVGSAEFPQRVMHHDAKIANVLFNSSKDGEVICLVDFDTVMGGYFFSDLGDMIRSMVCPEDENSTNYGRIEVRKDFYEAIINGYLGVMGKQLTATEKKYIHYAGILMIYMQALRFLTDYLEDDIYYHTNYPEQNLDRTKNQLLLLEQLEELLTTRYDFYM